MAGVVLMLPARIVEAENKAKAVELLAVGDTKLAEGDRFSKSKRTRRKGVAAYKQALAAYNEAHENFPNPKIYFPIALTEKKLGRHLDSLNHFKKMLEEGLKEGEEFPEELIEKAKAGIESARKHLAGIELDVPDGATVMIDETIVELGDEALYFNAGKHALSVELKGHKPYSEELELVKGEVKSHTVELETIPEIEVEGTVENSESKPLVENKEAKKADEPSRLPLELSFGFTGVFVLGSAFTLDLGMAKRRTSRDEELSDSVRDKAKKKSKKYFVASGALLGAATAAMGYGLYYYYGSYRPAKRKHEKSALHLVPTANREGMGLALLGRF